MRVLPYYIIYYKGGKGKKNIFFHFFSFFLGKPLTIEIIAAIIRVHKHRDLV